MGMSANDFKPMFEDQGKDQEEFSDLFLARYWRTAKFTIRAKEEAGYNVSFFKNRRNA